MVEVVAKMSNDPSTSPVRISRSHYVFCISWNVVIVVLLCKFAQFHSSTRYRTSDNVHVSTWAIARPVMRKERHPHVSLVIFKGKELLEHGRNLELIIYKKEMSTGFREIRKVWVLIAELSHFGEISFRRWTQGFNHVAECAASLASVSQRKTFQSDSNLPVGITSLTGNLYWWWHTSTTSGNR